MTMAVATPAKRKPGQDKMVRVKLATNRVLFTGATQNSEDVTEVPESQATDMVALGQAFLVPDSTPITTFTPQHGDGTKAVRVLHGPPPTPRSQLARRAKRPRAQSQTANAVTEMGAESDDDDDF